MDRRIELFRTAFEELLSAAGDVDVDALADAARGANSGRRATVVDVAGWLAPGAVPEQRFSSDFHSLVAFLEGRARGTGYRRRSARSWNEALSGAQRAVAEGEQARTPAAADADRRRPLLRAVPFADVLPHESAVLCAQWGAVGNAAVLATGTRDGVVRLWDVSGARPVCRELTAGRSLAPVEQVAWPADGRLPLVAARDARGTVHVWDAGSPGDQPVVVSNVSRWMAWGSDAGGPVLATGQADGRVRLWHPAAREFAADAVDVRLHDQDWGEFGISAGHPALAVGSWRTGEVAFHDLHTGRSRGPLRCDPHQTLWGAWGRSGDRAVLATAGLGGVVRVWDAASGAEVGVLHTGPAYERAWGRWGRRTDERAVLAVGGADGSVRLWDPVDNAYYDAQPAGHSGPVGWGAWCTVGDVPVLATGAADGTIRLWDPDTGTQFGEPVLGHSPLGDWGAWGAVDGRPVLATSRDEKTVRLVGLVEDRPLPRLPTYRSDSAVATDELSREGDATAIAELITARTVQPPLAVGLFGDWGEGKSHFMNLLQQRVAGNERTGSPLAQRDVRQVRFNAWHYAETDLWASLVAELFAQLSTPPSGDRGDEQRRQSRLTAELVQERGLGERLIGARKRRDELREALDGDLWEALPAERREELTLLLGGPRAQQLFAQATDTLGRLRSARVWARRLLGALPLRVVLRYLAGVVLALALVVAAYWGLPAVRGRMDGWWRALIAALPGTSAVLLVVAYVRKALRATRERLRDGLRKAAEYGAEVHSRVEIAANLAAEEVAALERQLRNMTAAGQLAGLVSDRVGDGQYRGRLGMMTQIREDFQRMARLLAEVAAEPDRSAGGPLSAAARADVVQDELPRIARIVLYIDDLDRCPSHRVVEVLEAIHLLLAVDLFVVVVAVDPRWLLHAIATHYRGMLDGPAERPAAGAGETDADDGELWRLNPAQYLEKIFQVVLTLSPMDRDGYRRLLRTLVGTRPEAGEDTPGGPRPEQADTPAGARAAEPAAGAPGDDPVVAPHAVAPGAAAGAGGLAAAAEQGHGWAGPRLPAAAKRDRVDPLTLEPDELALLNLLGPPLLVSTPRAVKRLANSYGLLNAIRRDHRAGDLAEQRTELRDPDTGDRREVAYFPYRAGMVLLALLVAYPTAGPAFFQRLHHRATTSPGSRWREFQEEISAARAEPAGPGADGALARTPAVRPDQWRALVSALGHVTDAAERRGLPLPEPLEAWAAWLVPVSRLSFPTGLMIRPLGWQGTGEG
ncbi:hypothetical protein RVR_8697 [Actinacidiphila reveromycinica]|uniref:KAP NTPase domain-containing protein n=1 Tax=Actinacidiphila reveromycinica TaxID=659352 RepID=A0A7U3UYY6_9ACTN|nr:P-loop NTPase fold protein [Streptomyces sp. SN-593]BBB01333.1 hypothetical protein RVR_8697 [Streptomyces sp. SN-593]